MVDHFTKDDLTFVAPLLDAMATRVLTCNLSSINFCYSFSFQPDPIFIQASGLIHLQLLVVQFGLSFMSLQYTQ